MQDAGPAGAEAGGVRRLDPDQLDVVVQEAGEEPDRVRAAADARDRCVGQPALELEDLGSSLARR